MKYFILCTVILTGLSIVANMGFISSEKLVACEKCGGKKKVRNKK